MSISTVILQMYCEIKSLLLNLFFFFNFTLKYYNSNISFVRNFYLIVLLLLIIITIITFLVINYNISVQIMLPF